MTPENFPKQSGITLVEILVVIALTAIIAGFAVVQFGNSKENFQRQNIARELKVNLERARFDSVKRRPDDDNDSEKSKVVIESDTSFTVYLDFNQDGIVSSTEKREVDFGYMDGIKIVGQNLVFPITIKFDRRGHITVDGTGSNIKPTFIICDKDCTFETATDANSSKITVSQTGTVTMTGGGESDTIFGNPTVSDVGRCDGINSWVTVADPTTGAPGCAPNASPSISPSTSPSASPSASPSPSPSPSPSTSPSATPQPTATPTPTPTPTPIPTPTPNACSSGQKPGNKNPPACVCYLPMTVRTNGKCM